MKTFTIITGFNYDNGEIVASELDKWEALNLLEAILEQADEAGKNATRYVHTDGFVNEDGQWFVVMEEVA